MILLIDNYDSFTYNIVQYCRELKADIEVIRNDTKSVDSIKKMNPEKIIISPGPSNPDNAGITLDLISEFKNKIPILGICLGHQSIAQHFGAKIIRANKIMHGKVSIISVTEKDTLLFKDIPKSFNSTRYHSLVVNKINLNPNIIPIAYSLDDNEIMALRIKDSHIYGVQFHPESIMSEYGHKILSNFLEIYSRCKRV